MTGEGYMTRTSGLLTSTNQTTFMRSQLPPFSKQQKSHERPQTIISSSTLLGGRQISKFSNQGSKTKVDMRRRDSVGSQSRIKKISDFQQNKKERTLSRGFVKPRDQDSPQTQSSNNNSQKKLTFRLNLSKIGLKRGIFRTATARGCTQFKNNLIREQDSNFTKVTSTSKQNLLSDWQSTSRVNDTITGTTKQTQIRQNSALISVMMNTARALTPYRRSTENLNPQFKQQKKLDMKENRSSLGLLASPQVEKPDFAQVIKRASFETLLTSQKESISEVSDVSSRPLSPAIQLNKTTLRANKSKLKELLSVASHKYAPSPIVSNLQGKHSNSRSQSRSRKQNKTNEQCGFYNYCCLVPQHTTKSDEQIKITTPSLAVYNDNKASMTNFNKLNTCKSGTSLTHQRHMITFLPRVHISDDPHFITSNEVEPQQVFYNMRSSDSMSYSDREGNVEDDVPNETQGDHQNSSRNRLQKQNQMHTMTLQNKRLSAALNTRIKQNDRDSQVYMVRHAKCTQSFADMEDKEFKRPASQPQLPFDDKIDIYNRQTRIKSDSIDAEPPRLAVKYKKSNIFNFFHTPKPTSNKKENNLMLVREEPSGFRGSNRMFQGGKPLIQCEAIFSDNCKHSEYTFQDKRGITSTESKTRVQQFQTKEAMIAFAQGEDSLTRPSDAAIINSRDEPQGSITTSSQMLLQNSEDVSGELILSQKLYSKCAAYQPGEKKPREDGTEDSQAIQVYRVVGKSREDREKAINSFLDRQKSREERRKQSISSTREKIFVAETTSEVCSKSRTRRNYSRSSKGSEADVISNKQPKESTGGFLKRMAVDTAKRRRFLSPNHLEKVTPRGEINLCSIPRQPKLSINTPECNDGSEQTYIKQLLSSSKSKSARSKMGGLSRLMRPIGQFSSSLRQQINISNLPETKAIQKFNVEEEMQTKLRVSAQESVATTLQLSQIQASFLAKATQQIKPGKHSNDKIMLQKLEAELRPMQKRAAQSIVLLTRDDFYLMLFELEMLLRPIPSQRDVQDAQAFLDILFPPKVGDDDLKQDADISELQRHNYERMALFSSLVKTLLLHETDANLIVGVEEPYRRSMIAKIISEKQSDYRDWLSDRFFIFYLNRTRTQRGNSKDVRNENASKLRLEEQNSIESRYVANMSQSLNSRDNQTPSDILEQPKNFLQQTDLITVEEQQQQRRPRSSLNLFRVQKCQVKSLKRQKAQADRLIDYGVKRKTNREEKLKQKEEEVMHDYEQYELNLKERIAQYPWIEEEMKGRKTECLRRLHIDGLRRLGLPLPEFEEDATPLELLDAKFEVPSIYQAIQQDGHAPFEKFQSTTTKIERDLLKACLNKYKDLIVPGDEFYDGENSEDDEFMLKALGNLPVLLVNLQDYRVSEGVNLPKLLLYSTDSVVQRVQAYVDFWPLPDATIVALIEHIAFKVEQLIALER